MHFAVELTVTFRDRSASTAERRKVAYFNSHCGRKWAAFEDDGNMTENLCFWKMSSIINAQVLGGLRIANSKGRHVTFHPPSHQQFLKHEAFVVISNLTSWYHKDKCYSLPKRRLIKGRKLTFTCVSFNRYIWDVFCLFFPLSCNTLEYTNLSLKEEVWGQNLSSVR